MQSISGIVTQTHSTKGDIPPPLVGSSISVVGDQVFVFAGRLVTSRKMTNHLYVLDLKSLVWSRHIPPPDSEKAPKPRYFHSVNVYGRLLVVFGGMGYSRQSADGLCVLDDVAIFNINTMTWKQPAIQPSLFAPRPRYAHLATISAGQLLVVGGQDMNNGYLSESNVLDLESLEWVKATTFEQHVGAYRSVAVATPSGTALPANMGHEVGGDPNVGDLDQEVLHLSGLSSEAQLLADKPGPIFLYSNHNFANVNRDLKIITEATHSTVDDAPIGKRNHHLSIDDISHMMTGSIMPPGLRFPTGDCIGQHIVIAGTYLSPQSQSYSIWGLNTATLTWTRVDTGSIFTQGSWNRGILYAKQNRYLVFGNSSRNLLEDYNHRQINFDHLAMVDLESFGIYQHPPSNCAQLAQEMGLRLLDEPSIADFYILTRENQEIPVNSAVIRYRWPYFAKILDEARNADQYISDELVLQDIQEDNTLNVPTGKPHTIHSKHVAQSMVFPYPYPVVVAFLQFLYTDSLLTAQQYQPHILSQLLLLGDMYSLPRLVSLSRHALHQMLNMSTAPLIFETAALSHQISLQIRALKLMIAAKKMIQHQAEVQSLRFSSQMENQESASSHHREDKWENESVLSSHTMPPHTPTSISVTSRMQYNPVSPSLSVDRLQSIPSQNRHPFVSSTISPIPSRPSTALNYYGSTRLATMNIRNGADSVNQIAPSTSLHESIGYLPANPMQSPSIAPDDDSFSMSSFSVYGTTASLTGSPARDVQQQRRADKRFFNAIGNKFTISKS